VAAARKTRDVTSFSLEVDGHVVSTSATIGVSLFPQHSYDPSTLLKLADQAMYAAKRRGKNGFAFYTPPMAMANGAL
ncbi:MAG TPA: diguanylate cyclase, partial [Gammaproteobacteria bacterium]|nr:diguanylate cyclase [Gammaproteobacteria bacterium]